MADYGRFPHLKGATDFPDVSNVDVYKYKNDFDYSRWQDDVTYRVVNVPWCGDYDNVVEFEDEAARDAYIDSLPGARFDSSMVHVKPGTSIKLPIPIDNAQLYNYLVVDFPVPTSPAQPIEGAQGARLSRYLYFLDDATQASASATLFQLRADVWQTYIYQMRFDYLMLERGHAPMAATSAGAYLKDPISNNGYLLAPEGGTGTPTITADTEVVELADGDMLACFAMYADASKSWGSVDTYTNATPAQPMTEAQGAPAPTIYALPASQLEGFLQDVDADAPAFKACVKALFFMDSSLANQSGSVSFIGYTLRVLDAVEIERDAFTVSKRSFGYPSEIADIAKLYTWPYACLRASTADGDSYTIRIEETSGTVRLAACASLIAPDICIRGRLLGIGGDDFTVSYRALDKRSFTYGGSSIEYLLAWDVPCFAVAQSSAVEADWTQNYERRQQRLSADNALTSAKASNATAQTNANNSASNITANNAVTVAANNAVTAEANSTASDLQSYSNALASANLSQDNAMTTAAYQADLAGIAVATTNNNLQYNNAGLSTLVSSASSLMTGDIGGAVTSMISGIANASVSNAMANNSFAVSQSNSTNIYNMTISANSGKLANNTSSSNTSTARQNEQRSANNTTQNNAATSIAANNASLIRTNAANTRSTADANAGRTHDTAVNAISNHLSQQGTRPPVEWGAHSVEGATVPPALIVQAMTQPLGAIREAASGFLRYGYTLNQQWEVTRLQVMKHFTYWKCSEVWCSGEGNAIEGAQQVVKDIMTAGTTVWSDPDEIGKVSIYDNL